MALHDGAKPKRLLVVIDVHDTAGFVLKLQTPPVALLRASVAPRRAAR
jgi:hypothetical protein